MAKTEIRVRAKINRYSFDGQTGILVLAGTKGTVGRMMLETTAAIERDGFPKLRPTLDVYWDYALAQDKANDDPMTTTMWEETIVSPAEVEYIGAITEEENDTTRT